VWDEARGCPDEAATPSYGARTLEDFYRRVLTDGLAGQELGAAAVFDVTAASPRGRERR
jgi:divinyl chlorophyllide a 8-vinyl-reductase